MMFTRMATVRRLRATQCAVLLVAGAGCSHIGRVCLSGRSQLLHPSATDTISRFRERYHFPNAPAIITQFVRDCHVCQHRAARRDPLTHVKDVTPIRSRDYLAHVQLDAMQVPKEQQGPVVTDPKSSDKPFS